ncbi:acylphosphatase [Caulobacter sp. 17J80-11]|uniref:acylphosphatase n=1 Tax=Caulobacter sp. 17J80-11 TaxID=2763502 RepID=UPI0016534A4D|nr:acylphosphatase [Caulobacter sp. 17J80-11]MBC6980451.1 acylphosphatase [Caulobacter sp. 17J80-11]
MRHAERLTISGRVQGVGYRAWAVAAAQRKGLEGWVRNRRDGTVELLAIGEREAIDALATACRAGPPGADVERVERAPAQDDGTEGFGQRPTE